MYTDDKCSTEMTTNDQENYQNYLKQFICPHWGNSYVNPTLGKILCSYKNTYKDHENIKYLKFYI